ncbi:L-rhamnose isomerase [Caldicellulosiruptor saccharolyticus DSM 8903]|uniref:L-rhamnose isomerase n=1 Tax=Caldicellulosiruptor saccharolyticus (strain ATCC 43494 / DSM 8903 / Tp8T 6331) TaxID=351627 RepID=A4XHV7_CALS8|nr:L-rhamnose isomerase [Caldicellulosiruptor saccharolyticus]ABP66492.1 L-rhamnose isomerase [Caldicellulosiruptor saccharolyticus DSM 8903]
MVFDGEKILPEYERAKEAYAQFGVDTDGVLEKMKNIKISLHCWQGDDVTGFEEATKGMGGGGILATGNYFGKARNGDELRQDLEFAMSLIPGKHKVNLHAIYAETNGKKVDRDQLSVEHFEKWINWAKEKGIGLDFNPTFFAHPKASSGYTLSSKDESIRKFWVQHAIKSREIASVMGKETGQPCINNIWIPDGSKDFPVQRYEHRKILKESLDEIFDAKVDKQYLIDSVESKLFGIGSEAYVVGSHEFYMGYVFTSKHDIAICFDLGHFHPTETISDKISAVLAYSKKILLHLSRGMRWDSDHVVILNDEVLSVAQEVKRTNGFEKVYFALDFFDASINRITAWVTGARAALKAILFALLEPTHLLIETENEGNFGMRLALLEEFKTLPFSAVWNKYCYDSGVPVGSTWLEKVKEYEEKVLKNRV